MTELVLQISVFPKSYHCDKLDVSSALPLLLVHNVDTVNDANTYRHGSSHYGSFVQVDSGFHMHNQIFPRLILLHFRLHPEASGFPWSAYRALHCVHKMKILII